MGDGDAPSVHEGEADTPAANRDNIICIIQIKSPVPFQTLRLQRFYLVA